MAHTRTRTSTTPSQPCGAVLLLATAMLAPLAMTLGGCSAGPRAFEYRANEGLESANLGASATSVFTSSEIAAAIAVMDYEGAPEYGRNNDDLSYRDRRAFTAVDRWPQQGIPDIRRRRTTTIIGNNRSFQFFLPSPATTPYGP